MFQDPAKLDYIKERLLQTWSPEQIANTPWEKELPSVRTIYRWNYEKYIDVSLKALRRKGKIILTEDKGISKSGRHQVLIEKYGK